MSFAPVFGPGSSPHAYTGFSVSACIASLAAFCSSLLATMVAMVDNLAMRIPSSYCLACHFKRRRESENNTTALVFDPGTEVYTLKRLEDIDGESTVQLSPPPPPPSLDPRAHIAHSRESHLPRFPPLLGAIHQSPALRSHKIARRSRGRCVLEQEIEAPARPVFARRRFLHRPRDNGNPNDHHHTRPARAPAGRTTRS